MKNFNVNKDGFYGDFGGAFIPEMLFPNIDELQKNYIKISESKKFKKEFNQLLHDYVGRPTPLYYAKRLSEKFETKIYLKRLDVQFWLSKYVNDCLFLFSSILSMI